jgi:hypothetical protein
MKKITNKTRRPLAIPLPHGKKLHLGPRKTGQIATNSADHPPLKKLVDAGQIEIDNERTGVVAGAETEKGGAKPMQGHPSGGVDRHGGDR